MGFGLFTRKVRWGLSLRGGLVLGAALIAFGIVLFLGIQPFLAVHAPVPSDLIVVEGWISKPAIRQFALEFRKDYPKVYTVGGPVEGVVDEGTGANYTYAQLGAAHLREFGVRKEDIVVVSTQRVDRDRTYTAAHALGSWLAKEGVSFNSLNVVSEGAHARRSRLLFQKAFGPNIRVGIINVPHPGYQPGRWWRYSEGIKEVVSEGAAYLYVRLFFWP